MWTSSWYTMYNVCFALIYQTKRCYVTLFCRKRMKNVPLVHVMVDGPRHEDGHHGSERLALAVEVVRRYRVQFLLVRVPSQFL